MTYSANNHNRIKNHTTHFLHGFTLVEVVIVMGVMSVLGLAMTSLVTMGTKSVTTNTANTQFNSLIATLQSSVQNDSSCAAVINSKNSLVLDGLTTGTQTHCAIRVGKTFVGGTTPAPRPVPSATISTTYGNLTFNDISLRIISTAPEPVPGETGKVNVNANLVITANKPGYNPATRTSSSTYGSAQLSNSASPIQLTLQVDKSSLAVLKCTGLRIGNKSQFNLPICNPGEFVESNGSSLNCKAFTIAAFPNPAPPCNAETVGQTYYYITSIPSSSGIKVCTARPTGGSYIWNTAPFINAPCLAAGGTMVTVADGTDVCQINGATCPSGMSQYLNWSTTTPTLFRGIAGKSCDPYTCTTPSHTWENKENKTETCSVDGKCCPAGCGNPCINQCGRWDSKARDSNPATITQIGCVNSN